jgi:hypothetical protein
VESGAGADWLAASSTKGVRSDVELHARSASAPRSEEGIARVIVDADFLALSSSSMIDETVRGRR